MITVNEQSVEERGFKPFVIEIHVNTEQDCRELREAMNSINEWGFADDIEYLCNEKLL